MKLPEQQRVEIIKTVETCPERAEGLSIVQEMTKAFIGTVELYKADHGGAMTRKEAVKEILERNEGRRKLVEGLEPEKVNWTHIAAVGEAGMQEGLML